MAVEFVKTGVYPQGIAPCNPKAAMQMVELCGRTAYKSEDKISEDSARSFVLMLKNHGHLSVLEHSNVVLRIDETGQGASSAGELKDLLLKLLKDRNAYHRLCTPTGSKGFAISGSYRGWLESLAALRQVDGYLSQLLSHCLHRYHPEIFDRGDSVAGGLEATLLTESEQLEILKADPSSDLPLFIFKIVCDRGITHEVVRHRVFSFTQESTRYVNYKNKGMTLILPEELYPFFDEASGTLASGEPLVEMWTQRAEAIFSWYQEDLGRGLRPEIARDILPNLLKSEIFASGRWSGWQHFIRLRDSKHAHPRIRAIAGEIRRYFESLGLFVSD